MNLLQIRRWTDSETTHVQFVGWKDRTRRAFWVLTATGARREITLQLPNADKIQFSEEAIPDAPPVGITRTVLCLPACRASKELATSLRTKNSSDNLCAQHFSPWELFTSHVVYPDPSDDTKLRGALREHKSQLRKKYNEELKQIKKLPKQRADEERQHLESRFTFLRSTGRTKELAVPLSKINLDDVKSGWGGILHDHLHAWTGRGPSATATPERRIRHSSRMSKR